MATYRVTFMKTIADDTGHEHRIAQRSYTVEAPDEATAREAAAAAYARAEGADWRLRADDVEVTAEPDPPASGSGAASEGG